MNHFSQKYIRQLKKEHNFPSNIIEKDCHVYKELIFEDNSYSKGGSDKNLSECFIVESANKDEENKAFQSRGWKGNENNKKTLSKNLKIRIYLLLFYNF